MDGEWLMSMNPTASHGETERTKVQQGAPMAGTNLPEEAIECRNHIRKLIDDGYSYLFMERYLLSMGYPLSVVRKEFQAEAGITADQAVNFDSQYSPGNIPQFNLGWGKAKAGKGTYFIMPMHDKYGIFHQKEDRVRELVKESLVLSDAVDEAKKLVSKLERWDPPVKDNGREDDVTQLYRQPQLFMQAQKYVNELQLTASIDERRAMINQHYVMGNIGNKVRSHLLKVLCDETATLEDAALSEKMKDAADIAYGQFPNAMPRTPQEVFQRSDQNKLKPIPNWVFDQINVQLEDMISGLKDFSVVIRDVHYSSEQPSGATNIVPLDEPDDLNSTATVSVLIDVIDRTATGVSKPGMIVFTVIGGKVGTSGIVKGNDKQSYSMNDEAFRQYLGAETEVL